MIALNAAPQCALALLALSAAPPPLAAAPAGEAIIVSTAPAPIYIERGELQQLNFDFVVDNGSAEKIDLTAIELSVYDQSGKLSHRRSISSGGASPALLTVMPDRSFEAGKRGLFYNPFTTFGLSQPLDRMRYTLTFTRGSEGPDLVKQVEIAPQPWQPRSRLILPVAGRAWVKNGHDFLAHHRRWNPLHPIAQSFGATSIFARYALDLMIVDEDGSVRRNGRNSNGDFYGWGAPLRAVGDGVVVAAYDRDPDDDLAARKSAFDPGRLPKEPLHFYGNYVIVDHGGGEFSLLGHIQQGSLQVKVGDRVRQGQLLARLGASGSAEFEPHLHYELRTGPTMAADGLPSYFHDFDRIRGARRERIVSGPVDSGEIVQSAR